MDRNRQRQGSGQGHHGRDQSQSRGESQQGGHGQTNRQQSQQGGQRQGGRQYVQQGGDMQQLGARQFQSIAEVALRGTALLWDLQMETARNVWRTQARTAAMLGIPDCSDLFEIGDERARRLFTMSADQVLNTARQARETVAEMQRQFGRIAEQQTIGLTEQVRDQIREIGRHTEQGLQEIRDIAASEAEQAEGIAQQSLDYGDEGSRHEDRQTTGQTGEMPREAQANASEWAPRFDAGATGNATNGTHEATAEAGNAMEANIAGEGRAQRESRSRPRR